MASDPKREIRRGRCSRLFMAAGLALLLPTAAASAQELDPETRRAALELAAMGDEAWGRGDYPAALEKFSQARVLVPAPTLALRQSECLEKLGRLIDASAVLQDTAEFPLAANASLPFRKAVAAARVRAEAMLARIPTLEIVMQGVPSAQATVSLDGKALTQEQWASPIRVDPGAHQVKAVAGSAVASERVMLDEGAHTQIVLRPELPANAAIAAQPESVASLAAEATPEKRHGQLRTWAWVGLGIGATGVLAGLATGIGVLVMRNDLDHGGCVASVCKPSQGGDVRVYNALRTASVAGFVVGGFGLASGAVLWFAEVRGERANHQSFLPFVGPGSVGVAGTF